MNRLSFTIGCPIPSGLEPGVQEVSGRSSCICAMECEPIVASPAPHAAKRAKRKQAQQNVGCMQFGWFEFNRSATWTRVLNEKQVR